MGEGFAGESIFLGLPDLGINDNLREGGVLMGLRVKFSPPKVRRLACFSGGVKAFSRAIEDDRFRGMGDFSLLAGLIPSFLRL